MQGGQAWDFDGIIKGLETDIPDILLLEPNWEYFAKDFKLIDQVGQTVEGLGPSKELLSLLREFHNKLTATPLKDDFKVQTEATFERSPDGDFEPVLMAQWRIEIYAPVDFSIQSLQNLKDALPKNHRFPLIVSGMSTFRFNPNGKVKSMKIDSWSLNGNELRFPIVTGMSEAWSKGKVDSWAKAVFQ